MNAHRRLYIFILVGLISGLLLWYAAWNRPTPVPIGKVVEIKAPLGLPPVPIPADNPPTAETIALGRRLYFDTSLSVDNTVSCATCHMPPMGFTDGQRVSTGVKGQHGVRNAPTVLNAAYWTSDFWDGRVASLEKQVEGPVTNPVEMAHTLKGVEQGLSRDPGYVEAFEKAFGPGPITYAKVEKCIASYERTLLSGHSPFDRYYYGGDKTAMTEAQIRGFELSAIRRRAIAKSATLWETSTPSSPTTSFTTSGSASITAWATTKAGRRSRAMCAKPPRSARRHCVISRSPLLTCTTVA